MDIKLISVKGIGPQTLKALRQHHIWSTYDLVLHLPKGYMDFQLTPFKHAKNKESVTVRAKVVSTPRLIRGQKIRVTFQAEIEESVLEVIAFGRGYLVKTLEKQNEILIKGIYHLYRHQIIASQITKIEHKDQLKPLYQIEGIHDRMLNQIIKEVFTQNQVAIYEILPDELIFSHHLLSRKEAYYTLHFPNQVSDIYRARLRFKYEEAFFYQLKLQSLHGNQSQDRKSVV